MRRNRLVHSLLTVSLALGTAALFLGSADAEARDWYVSAAKGKGKKGTKKKPARDLGNIVKKLKAGDVVHIAGGTYLGKGKNGTDVIKVPVSIIGGYDEGFSKRDPWGKTRTVLTGVNTSKNYKPQPRLFIDLTKYRDKAMPAIKVDGLVIDQGGQNRYKKGGETKILRKANPATGENPTPDRGALVISVSKTGNFDAKAAWAITVQNNVIVNAAPTKGALMVRGYKNSRVLIQNNIVANCTGSGIYASSAYRPRDNKAQPTFDIRHNTVLFTWKYDGMTTSYSGVGLEVDNDTIVVAQNNVIGFSDRYGVENHSRLPLLLKNNLITASLEHTYWETAEDAKIDIADLEDEAELLHEDSTGNIGPGVKVPVSQAWAKLYASRVLINRAKVEEKVKARNTGANALRGMLGLPLRAGTVKGPDVPVYLHRMSVDDAIQAGAALYAGRGSSIKSVR